MSAVTAVLRLTFPIYTVIFASVTCLLWTNLLISTYEHVTTNVQTIKSLIRYCLYPDKESLGNMVSNFTSLNICNKWLLTLSPLPFTERRKSMWEWTAKSCRVYRILKIVHHCRACRHSDYIFSISLMFGVSIYLPQK